MSTGVKQEPTATTSPSQEPAAQHTPGPWSISPTSNPSSEFGIVAIDGTIVSRLDYWHDEAEAESEANARLIAAAPELLAALRELLLEDDFDGSPDLNHWRELTSRGRQAIFKAEGRQ